MIHAVVVVHCVLLEGRRLGKNCYLPLVVYLFPRKAQKKKETSIVSSTLAEDKGTWRVMVIL